MLEEYLLRHVWLKRAAFFTFDSHQDVAGGLRQ